MRQEIPAHSLKKRDMMLTLVFLHFIGEKYEYGVEKLRQTLIEKGLDPDDKQIRAAFFDDARSRMEHIIRNRKHVGQPLLTLLRLR